MSDDGTLRFGAAIDTSDLDGQTQRIIDILSSVPDIDINMIVNTEPVDRIGEAFRQVDQAIMENEANVAELNERLAVLRKQFEQADKAGDNKQAAKLNKEIFATNKLIEARKKALQVAGEAVTELQRLSAEQEKGSTKTDKNTISAKKNEEAHVSLRQRLKELQLQLVELEAAGMRGTKAYQDIQEEAANLSDALSDARQQVSILANDQAGFQGMMSGLTGLSGAFGAAQGAIALFGGENEELQKVMLKVQSVMAITMSLQQVQATLNKDSAFSLVTLNGLKEWWNKLLAEGTAEQAAEVAVTESDIAAQTGDAAATTANATAHEVLAISAGNAATAEVGTTAATGAETAAATAGTAANFGLAASFRAVGAAIKSIPIFGWLLAALSAIIGLIVFFVDKSKKMSKQIKENNEMLKDSRKTYAEAKAELNNYKAKIDEFNGSADQEKKLVKELNSKYGEQMGYCKTLAEWKDKLAEKGEAYCQVMMQEAKAQAMLAKATDAYIHYQEVQYEWDHRKKKSTQSQAQFEREKNYKISQAKKAYEDWEKAYEQQMAASRKTASDNDIGGHDDPEANAGNGDDKPAFDAKAAARREKEAREKWANEAKAFTKEMYAEIAKDNIEAMNDGLEKELAQAEANTKERQKAWEDNLRRLAESKKEEKKAIYIAQEGATEEGWEASEDGMRSIEDYMQKLLNDSPQMAKAYNEQLQRIIKDGENERNEIIRQYNDAIAKEFGDVDDQVALVSRKWSERINSLPEHLRDRYEPIMLERMNKEISDIKMSDFKMSIDWESVFGDMSKQSLAALELNLNKIKAYFEANKGDMDVTQIKEYQEAIAKMENEIASRNPFTALHNSIKGISTAKADFVAAMKDLDAAQASYTAAVNENRDALDEVMTLEQMINSGELSKDSDEYAAALQRVAESQKALARETKDKNAAESEALGTRNAITAAYAQFSNNLRSAASVVNELGEKGKNLAAVFSDDIADAMDEALGFIDEMTEAATSAISAIGDLGKSVTKGMENVVENVGDGVESAAKSTSEAISTVEKASAILAIVSAALQAATAISRLFNRDGAKDKEIGKLQERIDQLQWELDNADAITLRNNVGDAVDRLRQIYRQTTDEVLRLHGITSRSSAWAKKLGEARNSAEIYRKSVENIADAYAKMGYTANKALGGQKYANARKELENMAEQQLLIQKQIEQENSKKKKDNSKIQDLQNKINELAAKMAETINSALEEIIGYTAQDLARELGDAFIEAAQKGEDAMEAWQKKVNEIIADITKRMLITKFLEEPLGSIFDKYKKKWFGEDGRFKGFDTVIGSMSDFSADLNQVGSTFKSIWESLPDNVKDWFSSEDKFTQEGSAGGFKSMSENTGQELNGRFTAMQIAMEDTRSISSGIKADTEVLAADIAFMREGMSEMQNIALLQLDQLESINRNTKELGEMSQTLDRIDRNIQNL